MRRAGLILLFSLVPSVPTLYGLDAHSPRDARHRVKRSQAAMKRFRERHPCPSTRKTNGTCPGWQIVYKVPLEQGGATMPSNMHWLSDEERKAQRNAN
jgi:hypothetical protein